MSILILHSDRGHQDFICRVEDTEIDANTAPGNPLEPVGMVRVSFSITRKDCQIFMGLMKRYKKARVKALALTEQKHLEMEVKPKGEQDEQGSRVATPKP